MFLKNIGPFELIILLVIVVLIFGVGRVGELGGALGKAIRDFRKEVRGDAGNKKEEKTDKGSEDKDL